MKVLVADKFEKSGLEGLQALGTEVLSEPELQGEHLAARIRESAADVLIVRSTKVTADMLAGTSLKLIIRAGAGYNTIDVGAASENGIYVANCPGKNGQAVAELAFGLMLAVDRRIPDNVLELRAGKWNKKDFSKARGMFGRTLGLVGMGNIGQDMIPRSQAFGMPVLAYSRWMSPEVASALGIARADSLVELAQRADFVSVHVSLTPDTRGMLGREFFEALGPGTVFVNTSRAEVVDQDALLEACKSGRVFAGLDVFDGEPAGGEGPYEGPLKDAPNVYCTHHIGASTEQAQEAVAAETVRIVKEFMHTGIAPNVVNVQPAECATHLLVVRHLDKVGVLAHVLGSLRDEGLSVQEMENVVLRGARAAIAQIAIDRAPSDACLCALKANRDVLDASAIPISR